MAEKASDLDCGNFLEKIYKDTNVKKKINNLMFIGNHYYELLDMVPESQKDELRSRCLFTSHIYDYKNKQYKPGWLKVVEKMLDNSHEKVYVSMDLDVLHGDDFLTCYEPGILRSVQLMQILTLIKEKKKIIGADVVGYVGRNPVIELQIYKKIVNTLLQ
ncbi:MAG: arginase family protein [Nanoarchaeota archaeon]|nr:arginase family protein [Nanoarchaeota archaeon]MCG2720196.1 arginase family protein [Nanoarchaeota archaeon]